MIWFFISLLVMWKWFIFIILMIVFIKVEVEVVFMVIIGCFEDGGRKDM